MREGSEAESLTPTPAPSCAARSGVPAEEKAQWVKRFHESGLSLRQFSVQHSVPLMSLCRWVKRAKDPEAGSPPPKFEELKLPPLVASPDWAAELTLPNDTVLRLSKEVPAALVDQLLRARGEESLKVSYAATSPSLTIPPPKKKLSKTE